MTLPVPPATFQIVISISIDELHAHTSRWVRTAAAKREEIVVTDGQTPVAVLRPHPAAAASGNPFLRRQLLPAYAALLERPTGGTDSAQIVSEDRDRGADW